MEGQRLLAPRQGEAHDAVIEEGAVWRAPQVEQGHALVLSEKQGLWPLKNFGV